MSQSAADFTELAQELKLKPIDDWRACGEVRGLPVCIAALDGHPLALAILYRVDPAGSEFGTVSQQLEGAPPNEAQITRDGGFVRLAINNLAGRSTADLQQVIEHFADLIQSTDLGLDPGCLRCQSADGAGVQLVEGKLTRICPQCLAAAFDERQALAAQLNQSSYSALLGLPGAVLIGALLWGTFWFVADLLLEWGNVVTIDVNKLTILLMLIVVGVVGFVTGWPMGATVRRSPMVRRAPIVVSAVLTLAAAIIGEIMYTAALILRLTGLLDFNVAAQVWPLILEEYSGFWIVCKLLLAGSIGLFCSQFASEHKHASLNV